MRTQRRVWIVFSLLAPMLAVVPTLALPPANDSCLTAAAITSIPQTLETPVEDATWSPGEAKPSCYPAASHASVWFRYTPSVSRQVAFDSSGSTTNSIVTVYRGSCAALQEIDCDFQYGINDWWSHGKSDLRVEAGVTYYIRISDPFDPPPGSLAHLEARNGTSAPITVTVRDAATGERLAGNRVWLRDDEGGNYTLRDSRTGSDGSVTLFPPLRSSFEAHAIRPLYRNEAAGVTNASGSATVTLLLDRMGSIPAPPALPHETRLAGIDASCIVTMLSDGTDKRWVCPDGLYRVRDPVFSSDGDELLFFGQAGTWKIHRMNADGTNLRVAFDTLGSSSDNLAWSPDGRYALYDRYSDAFSTFLSIFRVDLDTGTEVELIPFGWKASYSPDGTMIVYEGTGGLRIARADGSMPIEVSPLFGSADWSPDGTRLVVDNGVVPNSTGFTNNSSITMIAVDGSDVRTIVADPYDGFAHPVWSPDGRRIAYMRAFYEDWYLTRVDADGTGNRQLSPWPTNLNSRMDWAAQPSGGVDGDESPRVRVLDPDGGEWWRPGEQVVIRWDASDDVGIVSQSVYLELPGQTILLANGLLGSARSLTAQVPDLHVYGDAYVRVESTDTVGQPGGDVSRYGFSIARPDQSHTRVEITHPSGGETFTAGEVVHITWVAESYFTFGNFELEISWDGGNAYHEYIEPFVSTAARSFDWTVPGRMSGEAVIRIRATTGLSFYSESGTFATNVPVAGDLELAGRDDTTLTWAAALGSASYDVVRGDLSALRRNAGRPGWIDLGAVTCLAAGASSYALDPLEPPTGGGFFYLVRPRVSGGSFGFGTDGLERRPTSGGCL